MLEGLRCEQVAEHHQWLFHNNTFQDWIRSRDSPIHSRLLWVTGTPGSGKTTAIQGAYHRLLEEPDVLEGGHHVAAFFFKRNDVHLLRDPDGMYRALSHQILSRQRSIMSELMKTRRSSWAGEGGSNSHRHSAYDYKALLLEVLGVTCRLSQRTTILIDALDECVVGDRLAWDKFFHDIVNLNDFRSLDICLCSRHYGALSWHWLRPHLTSNSTDAPSEVQSPVIEVETTNQIAIRGYLDEQLRVYSSETAELAALKEEIVTKSSGIFLWVKEILDRLIEDLRGHEPARLELRLQPIPTHLQELYLELVRASGEPTKTWRLLQWLLLAPDLSLRAWRDLIPFLQDKAPRSLKESQNSKDWASGSGTSARGDTWVLDLQHIVCRISLGLAQVAEVSGTNLGMPAGDRHSIAGEAGSWHTADGDMRLVRPIHESLRQFLQVESGFEMLETRTEDQCDEGLMMAMDTCLDFIKAREFSSLSVISGGGKNSAASRGKTASLLSEGDASARTSVSRFSSARSMTYKPVHHRRMCYSVVSSGGLSSEDLDPDDQGFQTTAVLARLKQEADHFPESVQKRRHWIERWRESVGGQGDHFTSTPCSSPCSSLAPSCQPSARSLRWNVWSSEFLTYILIAFPRFAQFAEHAGIDSSPIVIRLREGGLWRRWLFLSEELPKDTTLNQWAESQRLHTWVKYLSRTRENPYISQSVHLAKKLGLHNLVDHKMNVNYCFDGGESFVKRSDLFDVPRPVSLNSFDTMSTSLKGKLKGKLVSGLVSTVSPIPSQGTSYGPRSFIPYKSLRAILTEPVVADLLERETKLAPQKAREVRESYIRVLGILIYIDQVAYFKTLFEAAVTDACLPLSFSHKPGKDISATSGLAQMSQWLFDLEQWRFLSPFLARPAGQLLHYKLGSFKTVLPIIQLKNPQRRLDFSPNANDTQEEVQFYSDSFDFGEYGVSLPHKFLALNCRVMLINDHHARFE